MVIALVTRWRAGHWHCGTAAVVAVIVGVVTGVPAVWYGWVAVTYGIVASYMLGLATVREAVQNR